MFLHELVSELKTYMDPTGRGGNFVVALVGDALREPMTDEEVQMEKEKKFNPLASGISINMLDQIYGGIRFTSKAKAGLICSKYDGQDFAEEIDNLDDADKEHLQTFLANKGIDLEIDEVGSAVQNILNQMFHGLTKGIHDVDIRLTIHDPKPSIKSLAGDRSCEDGKLYIDGDVIELPIRLSDAQIYDFEAGYISALCGAYAEVLSRDECQVGERISRRRKYEIIV